MSSYHVYSHSLKKEGGAHFKKRKVIYIKFENFRLKTADNSYCDI